MSFVREMTALVRLVFDIFEKGEYLFAEIGVFHYICS